MKNDTKTMKSYSMIINRMTGDRDRRRTETFMRRAGVANEVRFKIMEVEVARATNGDRIGDKWVF